MDWAAVRSSRRLLTQIIHLQVTVRPEPRSFTINTGDMAQIWSNDRYHAPEHRVLTHPTSARYSAPMLFNSPFDSHELAHPFSVDSC